MHAVAPSSQNLMITVVSAHPANSKWWWNGAMRNRRFRVVRKIAICSTTESISTMNRPPMMSLAISRPSLMSWLCPN